MTPYALYAAGLIGATGLYLLMRPSDTPGGKQARILGSLVGLAGVAFLLVEVLSRASAFALPGDSPLRTMPVPSVILGLAAIAAATRMVTHQKPVFAALYFILVVVSSAGLFLTLQAEFMAFALIIVYAGAILITYMFVLMLAHQSPSSPEIGAIGTGLGSVGESGGDVEGGTRYDRVPREPFMAVLIGYLVLASLTHVYFADNPQLQTPASEAEVATANQDLWRSLETMPRRLEAEARRVAPTMEGPLMEIDGQLVQMRNGEPTVRAMVDGQPRDITLPASAAPTNTQSVGLALVSGFPASLELASVILLMAMFGAVVLARKQIELGEDERREAAGLRRLSVEDPEIVRGGRA